MTDNDKLMAFGTWLELRLRTLQAELFSLGINAQQPPARIRVKAGQLEAMAHVTRAFKDLYQGELKTFKEEYLDIKPEQDEDEKESHGSSGD